jgi:hypothetical protein
VCSAFAPRKKARIIKSPAKTRRTFARGGGNPGFADFHGRGIFHQGHSPIVDYPRVLLKTHLFEAATVVELADRVGAAERPTGSARDSAIPIQRDGAAPSVFSVPGGRAMSGLSYRPIGLRLGKEQPSARRMGLSAIVRLPAEGVRNATRKICKIKPSLLQSALTYVRKAGAEDDTMHANLRAMSGYQPVPYHGRVVVYFAAEDDYAYLDASLDPRRIWRLVAPNAEIVELAGDHLACWKSPRWKSWPAHCGLSWISYQG